MYTAIRSDDEQVFDTSEESEKKNVIVKKSLRPVLSRGKVEQAKKHGGFRPQRGYPGWVSGCLVLWVSSYGGDTVTHIAFY